MNKSKTFEWTDEIYILNTTGLHETVTNVFHIMEKWKYQFEMFDWNFVPLNITFAWSLHESNHSTNTEMQKSSEHGEHARAISFFMSCAYFWIVETKY